MGFQFCSVFFSTDLERPEIRKLNKKKCIAIIRKQNFVHTLPLKNNQKMQKPPPIFGAKFNFRPF
jgi:hypothetical protein